MLHSRHCTHHRCGCTVLFMDGILYQLLQWFKELTRLKELDQGLLKLSDMYRYVSVLLLSHTSGFSFAKTIEIRKQSGSSITSLEIVRFIADKILAYSATGRGSDGHNEWNSQRDQTRQLGEFEFRQSRKVFFVPLYLLATLDDDLFGTRAADNQVKMLSSRKADREGHSADALADALFLVVFALRFRRR